MKRALIFAEEIDRKIKALNNAKFQYQINAYSKAVADDIRELRDYCKFKGLNFEEIIKTLNVKGG